MRANGLQADVNRVKVDHVRRWLTSLRGQVAESTETTRASRGDIPGATQLFGRWRFDEQALEAWIASETARDPWAGPRPRDPEGPPSHATLPQVEAVRSPTLEPMYVSLKARRRVPRLLYRRVTELAHMYIFDVRYLGSRRLVNLAGRSIRRTRTTDPSSPPTECQLRGKSTEWTIPMPKLSYTPREAADETGISEETIRAAIRAGDLPTAPIVVNGRQIRRQIILHEDLVHWLTAERR
ncbi:DNA-binding protein [Actinobacteria bacterium YIM 96077]|uniref:Helix-turn-helix domain-containing protein n=1 Tax=Phytoactinopolyspora halophila TaxID=1981511 RepID=A0A329R0F5_9ACTN|nr:helix-turn-helix domain-containing protein [Phytoactinopolyspora halophila]AYY11519.1 DNA-binding protein [Actinobacteria bacterium YIM 96077]RAW17997.1 hypothetical protein DPM12_03950 [Phytoactinopolyspora halophila]